MAIIGDYRQVYAPKVFLKSLNKLSADITESVTEFEFTEDPQKMNLVTLKVADPTFAFTNDARFQQGVGYELRWGYLTDISEIMRFVASRITFAFPDANNMPIITLQAGGFEKLMNLTGSPKNHGPVSSSSIAKQIAERYSLKAEVADSKDARKQNRLQGADVTDFQFLSSLAKKLSWEFYIDRDTLYFQPFQFEKAPDADLVFYYRDDQAGTLLSFEPTVNKKPGLLGTSGADARTGKGKSSDVSSAPVVAGSFNAGTGAACTWGTQLSEEQAVALYDAQNALRPSSSSATQTQNKKVPVRFASPEETDTLLKANAEALSTHVRLQIEKATAVFIGSPRIRARKVIRLYNIGPYSGNWLVTGTTHKIAAETGYVVTATLARAPDKKTDNNKKTGPSSTDIPTPTTVAGAVDSEGRVQTWGLLLEQGKR